MIRRRLARAAVVALLVVASFAVSALNAADLPSDFPVLPDGTLARPLSPGELDGWSADDHLAASAVFRRHCRAIVDRAAALRPAASAPAALVAACSAELDRPPPIDAADARRRFETAFRAVEIVPTTGSGFLTGYYEPVVDGSLERTEAFTAPILARPDDLVTFAAGERPPGLDPALSAARRTSDGFASYPTRAAIETGALGPLGNPLVWLRDPVEVFLMQVQGSGRVRLPDDRVLRLVYAGRNGHPYTSIGRIIVSEGHVPLEDLSLDRLKAWLRANPADATRIMHRNASYVFFAIDQALPPGAGPIGGAGLSLTPWRSIAIDRGLWPYGLPVWIEVDLPRGTRAEPFRRLTIAQDTGSAIVGPARADLYHGSGEEAGRRAGALRHAMRFVVFWPIDGAAR